GYDEAYQQESKQLTRLTLTCVKPRDMEPADPFTIQGRPYIDQKGDFAVIATAEDEQSGGRPPDDDPEAVAKVIKLVESNPSMGIQAIRRNTGFGISRIDRILE